MARPPVEHRGDQPLRLRAVDADDLNVISAVLQDAVVPVSEMSFESADNRFVLIAGRFRWETAPDPSKTAARASGPGETPYERVHTAIRFEGVRAVRTLGIDRRDRSLILNLLSIGCADGAVELVFAGDAAIRLDVESLSCHVEDLGDPWPTVFRPSHDDGAA